MKTRIQVKERKEILRIRLPADTHERLQKLAGGVGMELPELGKFLFGAAARCRPETFHRAIAEMIAAGEK